jgi:hypothetical protein
MLRAAAFPLRSAISALPNLPTREEIKLWVQGLSVESLTRAFERHFIDNPDGLRLAFGIGLAVAGTIMLLSSLRRRRTRQSDLVRRVVAGRATEIRTGAEVGDGASDGDPVPKQAGPPAWLLAEPAAEGMAPANGNGRGARSSMRVPIGASLVRIGRHEENDVRFEHKTVHRYHAVLHRTGEGEFVITDLSGVGGNGIYVNGARIEQSPLRSGDLVELGAVRLRFEETRAH